MSQAFTIQLPEALKQTLIHQAAQTQTTPEQLIIQALNQYLQPTASTPETDPLLALIGCIDSDITDLAENHDYYIGQALYEEMHRDE